MPFILIYVRYTLHFDIYAILGSQRRFISFIQTLREDKNLDIAEGTEKIYILLLFINAYKRV